MKATLLALVFIHWLYDSQCCEQRHCHPVPCNEISATSWGWLWHSHDGAVLFTRDSLKASPDGQCHVCVQDHTHTQTIDGLCIYLPPQT